jgi:D-aminopeptidase
MNVEQFDTITRFAAEAPDRRNVLKMVGAAAVASVAGAVGSGAAEARHKDGHGTLVNIELDVIDDVVIGDILSDNVITVVVKNVNVAAQVCAVVQDINALFVVDEGISLAKLTCEIEQEAGDED